LEKLPLMIVRLLKSKQFLMRVVKWKKKTKKLTQARRFFLISRLAAEKKSEKFCGGGREFFGKIRISNFI
jgi:hypothetical protein